MNLHKVLAIVALVCAILSAFVSVSVPLLIVAVVLLAIIHLV